jgi:hypothetical protein
MSNLKNAETIVEQVVGYYPDIPILSRDMSRHDFTGFARRVGCGVLWMYDESFHASYFPYTSSLDRLRSEILRDHNGDIYDDPEEMPNGYILLGSTLTYTQEKSAFGHEVGHALLMRAGLDEPVEQNERNISLEMAAELLSARINLRPGALNGIYEPYEILEDLDAISTDMNVAANIILTRAMTDNVLPRAIQLFDSMSYSLITLGTVLEDFDMADSVSDCVGQFEIVGEYDGPYAFALPVTRPRQLQLLCGVSKRENKEWRAHLREAQLWARQFRRVWLQNN